MARLRSISGSSDTDLPAEAEGTITPQAKPCGAASWRRVGRRARGARGTSKQPPLHHSSLHSPLLCRKDTLAAGPLRRKAWHKPRRAEGGLPPMHAFINPFPHPVATFPEKAWMKETSSARLGDTWPTEHAAVIVSAGETHSGAAKGRLYPQGSGLDWFPPPAGCHPWHASYLP